MRKLFAFVFWIFTTILYALNIMFLVYLVAQTFSIEFLNGFCGWFATLVARAVPAAAITERHLGILWLIYLFICTPVVALLQHYGKNLGNSKVSFPLMKTLFGVLAGIFKIILAVALLCVIYYLVFNIIL